MACGDPCEIFSKICNSEGYPPNIQLIDLTLKYDYDKI